MCRKSIYEIGTYRVSSESIPPYSENSTDSATLRNHHSDLNQ